MRRTFVIVNGYQTYFLVWTKFSKTVKHSVPDKHFSIQYTPGLLITVRIRTRMSYQEISTTEINKRNQQISQRRIYCYSIGFDKYNSTKMDVIPCKSPVEIFILLKLKSFFEKILRYFWSLKASCKLHIRTIMLFVLRKVTCQLGYFL